MINTRQLQRSGLKVSEIGLGCATLGFNSAPESVDNARTMLSNALDGGINYFDTAPFYGRGLSERVVGDALRRTSKHVISSKVGRLLNPKANASTYMPFQVQFDYTYDGIMRSVEHSFQRLGLCKVDILYAHDLGSYTHTENAPKQFKAFFDDGGYRALDELRSSGAVNAIGLGVNEISVCEEAMDHGSFDVILLAGRYTLLERTSALPFFNQCAQAKTDIVIGGPFYSGMLVGGSTFNHKAIPKDVAKKHQKLIQFCKQHDVEVAAAAMQFPLRHDLVKSVIPGPKTLDELTQVMAWYNTPIPNSFWQALDELNDDS